jgi:hypothetical protein
LDLCNWYFCVLFFVNLKISSDIEVIFTFFIQFHWKLIMPTLCNGQLLNVSFLQGEFPINSFRFFFSITLLSFERRSNDYPNLLINQLINRALKRDLSNCIIWSLFIDYWHYHYYFIFITDIVFFFLPKFLRLIVLSTLFISVKTYNCFPNINQFLTKLHFFKLKFYLTQKLSVGCNQPPFS